MRKDQFFDLCDERFAQGTGQEALRELCDEARRKLDEEDELELVGDFLVATEFDD